MQWLAHDADAPKLSSSGFSPVISYRSSYVAGFNAKGTGNITVAGQQSMLSMFSTAMTVFERSCATLMSNETALAAVRVRACTSQHLPFVAVMSAILLPHLC